MCLMSLCLKRAGDFSLVRGVCQAYILVRFISRYDTQEPILETDVLRSREEVWFVTKTTVNNRLDLEINITVTICAMW